LSAQQTSLRMRESHVALLLLPATAVQVSEGHKAAHTGELD